MDALALLRKDHEQVLDVLERLSTSPGPQDLDARKKMVTELVIAESGHESVEEQLFWPLVRDRVPGGAELADRGIDQEYAAKQVLHALDHTEAGQPDFAEMVNRVVTDGRKHIAYEENEVWPKVRVAVTQADLDELGEKLAAAKKSAPTRPHPDTPSTPGVQKAVGPLAAAADKLRDKLTGRDRDQR